MDDYTDGDWFCGDGENESCRLCWEEKMSDYIKREDACRAMRQLQTDDIELYGVEIPECFDANRAINTLTSLPAADVVERKKGEWIYNPKDALEAMFTLPKCSLCGHESSDARNYCPNCGADMR